MDDLTDFERLPGYYRPWDLAQVLLAGHRYLLEGVGLPVDGGILFAVYMADKQGPDMSESTSHLDDLPSRLTIQDLATHWRVHVRTIERRVAAGRAPQPVNTGGRRLFRREDVLAWEEKANPDAGG